jgi:hypothetical protein
MSIYAKLRATPTKPRPAPRLPHTTLCITRGTSAEIVYPLLDGIITPEDLDQVTFVFKQDSKLTKYSMYTYLVPSTDAEIQENKIYYTISPEVEDSFQCVITKVDNPAVNPQEAGYFEISTDPTLNWTTCYHVLDPHFCWTSGDGYCAIIFNFSSTETKQFMPSLTSNFLVEYEVALAVNKGYADSRNTEDLVMIEPQPPIEVIDSLYSHV